MGLWNLPSQLFRLLKRLIIKKKKWESVCYNYYCCVINHSKPSDLWYWFSECGFQTAQEPETLLGRLWGQNYFYASSKLFAFSSCWYFYWWCKQWWVSPGALAETKAVAASCTNSCSILHCHTLPLKKSSFPWRRKIWKTCICDHDCGNFSTFTNFSDIISISGCYLFDVVQQNRSTLEKYV